MRSLNWLGQGIGRFLSRRSITLSMEDNVIRLVVFRGRQVVAWKEAMVEPDSVSQDPNISPPGGGGADRLRMLLHQLRARRGRLVTDLPLYTPLLRHLYIPKMGRRYLERAVATEVLDAIPFFEDEVDITWQMRSNDGRQDVFAIAVPRGAIDSHVRLVKEAGIRPAAVYPKAVALAFAAGVPDAILVHLEPSQAAIVLVRNSAPQVVHQVALPEGTMGSPEHTEVVARAVERVASYGQTLDPVDGYESLPVVLSGQPAAVREMDSASSSPPLAEALQQMLQRELLPFAPPLVYPEHFPASAYAINLGLVLADRGRIKARGRVPGQRAPSVNLLPARHLSRPLPVPAIGAFLALSLFGAASVYATGRVRALESQVQTLSIQLEGLLQQERQYKLSLTSAKAFEEKTQAANKLALALESNLAGLQYEMGTALAQLETVTEKALPPNVHLSSLVPQGNGFAVVGAASTPEEAIQFTANLRSSGLFADARILRLDIAEDRGPSGGEPIGSAQDRPVEPSSADRSSASGNVQFHVKLSLPSAPGAASDARSR